MSKSNEEIGNITQLSNGYLAAVLIKLVAVVSDGGQVALRHLYEMQHVWNFFGLKNNE